MRELKFRAWDKVDKFISPAKMLFEHEGKPWAGYGDDTEFEGEIGVHIEIMQFTGLHDKNGKEIYEGDILEFDRDEWYRFASADTPDHGPRSVVAWNDHEAGWDTGAGANSECSTYKEVIGNMHENPELI